MIFGKRLIALIIAVGGFTLVGSTVISKLPWYDNHISSSDLQKVFALTKNVRDVNIDPLIDSNVNNVFSKSLYSLFSSNLTTFSESFNTFFYKWALYQWANHVLENTKKGSFPSLKQKIFKALDSVQYKPNMGGDGTPFTSEHWTKNNNLITSAFKELNNSFVEFFFDKIWSNNEHTDISATGNELEGYGDILYARAMVEFQKFIFDEWYKSQRPTIVCKKSWKLNESFRGNIYKDSEGDKNKPDKPSIDWPDFSEAKDSIISFNKAGTCNENEVLTASSLSKLDGREIDAFISKYFSEINTEENGGIDNIEQGSEESSATITDVNKIFIGDGEINGSNFSQPNSSVIKDDGDLSAEKSKKFYSFRKVKFGESGNKKGIYVKTKEGITFFYTDAEITGDKIKEEILKANNNTFKDFNLSNVLKDFFSKNAGELLGKYLNSSHLENFAGIFGYKTWNNTLYNLIKGVSKYSEELKRNKSYWEAVKQLTSSLKDYSKIKFGSDNKPEFSAGLALPLWMKKNLDSTTSITESRSNSHFLSDLNNSNNGLFPLLSIYYSGKEWKPETLSIKASALRKAIGEHLNSIKNPRVSTERVKSEYTQSSYFLGDFILDNVYNQFLTKNDGKFIKNATTSLILSNGIKFDYLNNNLNRFADSLIYQMNVNYSSEDTDEVRDLLVDSIKNIYYGSQYLSEPIEERINYGGFKFEKNVDRCIRKITGTGRDLNPSTEPSGTCSVLESNQREWVQKITDYWLTKNYVFGDSGYELASDQTLNYLKFLFSISKFSQDNFSYFREFLTSQIPAGKHGAIVWLENAKNVSTSVSNGLKIGEGEASQKTLKEISKYFRKPIVDEIFNPYFSRSITPSQTEDKNLFTGHVSSFAVQGSQSYTEMYGFKGIYTEALNASELPENVSKAVFSKFSISNPKDNKNYLSNSKGSSDISWGLAYGSFDKDHVQTIINKVDEFATQRALKNYLQNLLPELVNEIWTKVSEKANKEDVNISLDKIKKNLKQELKTESYKSKLIALTSRFVGLVQNSGAEDSRFKSQQYYIPDKEKDTKGNLAFVVQVNKHDLNLGFADFVNVIGTDTLLKTVVSLAMQNIANQNTVNNYLSHKGVIL